MSFRHERLAEALPCTMVFDPIFASIRAELARGVPRTWGPTAGSPGLGALFELDEDLVLRGLELELLPYDCVDITPRAQLVPLCTAIREDARPGLVRMEQVPTTAINPDAVWLLSPFGIALFSFDQIVLAPEERHQELRRGLDFVRVADGAILGLARDTGKLRLLQLEGFSGRQTVFDVEISAERLGSEFVHVLDAIHAAYYADPGASVFEERAMALSARLAPPPDVPRSAWEGAMDALHRLVELYRRNLENMS